MKCGTPHFYEDELKSLFVYAFNSIITILKSILAAYKDIIANLTDNAALEEEAIFLTSECEIVLEIMR